MTIESASYKFGNPEKDLNITPAELIIHPEKEIIKQILYCSTSECDCKITFAESKESEKFYPQFRTFQNNNHSLTCLHYFERRENGTKFYPNQNNSVNQTKKSNSNSNNSLLKQLFGFQITPPIQAQKSPRPGRVKTDHDVLKPGDGNDIVRPGSVKGIGNENSGGVRTRKKELHEILNKDIGRQRRISAKILSIDIDEKLTSVMTIEDTTKKNIIAKVDLPQSFFEIAGNVADQTLEFIKSIKRYLENNPNDNIYFFSVVNVVSVTDSMIKLSIFDSGFPEFTNEKWGKLNKKFYLDMFISFMVTGAL